jgi:hypothetical protein
MFTRCYLALSLGLLGAVASSPLRAQNEISLTPAPGTVPQNASTQKAVAAATDFMNALIRDSSIDNLLNLCSLPFCHDDSVILTTRADLRNAFSQLIASAARDRAKTHPHVDSVYVLNIRKEAFFGLVPINIYFTVVRLKFTVRGQEASRLLILAVQCTDDAKVVGIEE